MGDKILDKILKEYLLKKFETRPVFSARVPREIGAKGGIGWRCVEAARLNACRDPQAVDLIGGEGVAGEASEARGIRRCRARERDEEGRGLADQVLGKRQASACRTGQCRMAFGRWE